MLAFVLKRLLYGLISLIGITFLVFSLLYLTGDPVQLMMPPDATVQEVEDARVRLGFDQPFLVQYFNFVGKLARFDLGDSLIRRVPVSELIKEYFPNTLLLATTAYLFALLVAVPAGVFAAIKRNSVFDLLISMVVLIGQAAPAYWVALMFVLFFSVQLGWFPTGGMGTFRHLVGPALSVGIFSMSRIARMARSSMLDVLRQDYIRTAKSQGISDRLIYFKFALKSAAIPIITLVGVEYAVLFGGSLIAETIFSWPGIGRLIVQSVYARDYPVVQGVVILFACTVFLVNLIVDLLYSYLDPRIKYGKVPS